MFFCKGFTSIKRIEVGSKLKPKIQAKTKDPSQKSKIQTMIQAKIKDPAKDP